ncbi:hypothetical protein K469DRAFT_607866, partial [Zopfia rhizophila CBS 207.26]
MPTYFDAATRAQVIALRSFSATIKETKEITGVSERTQRKIIDRAMERGYLYGAPNAGPLLDAHVEDPPKSGAPRKRTASFEEELAAKVRKDRYGREKGTETLARELTESGRSISHEAVSQTLQEMGFKRVKPTRKPGLTPKMRKERL